jgi:hypothetical protein
MGPGRSKLNGSFWWSVEGHAIKAVARLFNDGKGYGVRLQNGSAQACRKNGHATMTRQVGAARRGVLVRRMVRRWRVALFTVMA